MNRFLRSLYQQYLTEFTISWLPSSPCRTQSNRAWQDFGIVAALASASSKWILGRVSKSTVELFRSDPAWNVEYHQSEMQRADILAAAAAAVEIPSATNLTPLQVGLAVRT